MPLTRRASRDYLTTRANISRRKEISTSKSTWALTREGRNGIYWPEKHRVAVDKPRGVPEPENGQTLFEVETRLVNANIVIKWQDLEYNIKWKCMYFFNICVKMF